MNHNTYVKALTALCGVAFGFQVTLCIGRRFPGGCALRTSHRKGLHDKSLQMVQETPGRKLLIVTG